jgi:hypothetical protein
MADSTPPRSKKTLDAFADDLSSMMNIEDSNDAHQVGEIDEDDALDLLLVGDDFHDTAEDHTMRNAFIEEDAREISPDIEDEEPLADIMITPGIEDELMIEEDSDFDDGDRQRVKDIDEISTPELIALEQVADIEDFDTPAADLVTNHEADPAVTAEKINPAPALAIPEITADIIAAAAAATQAIAADHARQTKSAEMPLPADNDNSPQPGFDHGPELSRLSAQLVSLDAQLQSSRRDIAEKADRNTLSKCWDEIQKLQSTQGSGQHTPGALTPNRSLTSYIAIGLASAGLLLAAVTALQNLDANTRINDLQQTVENLQLQLKAAPQSAAANPESIQKQLDELKAADSVLNGQITEINKTLQKNAATAKTDATLNKKMAALNSQNLQVDAKLEALESKISALKKNPPLASPPTLPLPPRADNHKPAGAESWTVNLIAFKQDWIAKRKAEEYAGKGIAAKVSKTETKGENWYRLSVDGFKNQADANNYAAKVRKNLNLDTVSVTHNQD